MKRRRRDEILEQVLDGQGSALPKNGGEAESGERALLEDVRIGLKGLANQNLEPNRSVESLRSAILEQGLQSGRSAPVWAWAGPAAVVGVAAYLFMAQTGHQSTAFPPVVSAPGVESYVDKSAAEPLLEFPSGDTESVVAVAEPSNDGTKWSAPKQNRPSKRTVANRLASAAATMATTVATVVPKAEEMASRGAFEAATEDKGSPSPDPSLMMAAGPTDGAEAQIILIDSAADTETGASAATELESAANVVVGG